MRRNPRSSRGSVVRVLVWIVSSILLLTVVAAVGADMWLRGKYEPKLDAFREDLTANVDLFCEQQEQLAADPWFQEPRTGGDAGPLLNAWLGWDPAPTMPADSPLQLPASLAGKKDWDDLLASEVDFSALDFGWMRQLHAYDYWDTLENTPTPLQQPYAYMTAAVPNFIPLQSWAKFRLVHGLRTGQPVEAARDVRHLAWLAYRSDTLLGAMIATALLGIERKAHESMTAPPPEWRPMSLEQNERMRAVLWSSMSFSSIAAPTAVARKARHCGSALSRCIGLTEATGMARYLKPFAEGPYRQAYEALDAELASAPCPTSLARTIWEHGATLDDAPAAGSDMPDPSQWMRELPGEYPRKHIAGILLAIGTQDLDRLKKLRTGTPAPAAADATP
ncbi:hypothetical protein [Pyxidicoccus trucidator]|uniref:hypothetical protein n=1 Tax=Pyxidicoccus trucidator TaxID=2709662 RepID=UPI0013DD06FD|nr:hypothetical protein [Pyxidicoccus trucidator]